MGKSENMIEFFWHFVEHCLLYTFLLGVVIDTEPVGKVEPFPAGCSLPKEEG